MRGAHVCTRSRGGNQKVHQQEEARRREQAQSKDPGHMTPGASLGPQDNKWLTIYTDPGFSNGRGTYGIWIRIFYGRRSSRGSPRYQQQQRGRNVCLGARPAAGIGVLVGALPGSRSGHFHSDRSAAHPLSPRVFGAAALHRKEPTGYPSVR